METEKAPQKTPFPPSTKERHIPLVSLSPLVIPFIFIVWAILR
jgi:hypothetical protein